MMILSSTKMKIPIGRVVDASGDVIRLVLKGDTQHHPGSTPGRIFYEDPIAQQIEQRSSKP